MKHTLRHVLLLVFVVMCISALTFTASAADIRGSGTCGDDLNWELDSDGVLTISGTGPMWDYNYDAPWEYSPKAVIINNGVTTIGADAFWSCWDLTSVIFPNSLTTIGAGAFSECERLTSVTFPNSLTTVGNYAFYLTGLTELYLPNSVTSIGAGAFQECGRLTSVTFPNSLTTIGDDAFHSTGLTELYLPNSVTSIGAGAFADCQELTDVTLPNSITTISTAMLADCRNLSSITIPDSVTVIGDSAFSHIPRLTTITFPAALSSLGEYAFADCDYLNSIRFLGNAPSIGFNVFRGVTAKALYPGDNATWYDIENTYYGGNVTWIGVVTPTINNQPLSITTFEGKTAKFSVGAEGGALSYKWYVKHQGESDWSAVPGGTKAALSVSASAANNGSRYYCHISNVVGSVDTNTVELTVKPLPQAPTITGQPESITREVGSLATFSVQATGEELEYQWYYAAPSAAKWTEASEVTAKTKAYSFMASAALNGFRFRCEVSNGAGSVTSEEAVLTIGEQTSGQIITGQPKSITVADGAEATFTVTAQGEGLGYQWQIFYVGATDWLDMNGETGPSHTFIAAVGQSGNRYRCIVYNAGGEEISEEAKLTVVTKPKITTQPKAASVKTGKKVTFKVKAAGGELTYQWYYQKPKTTKWVKVKNATKAIYSFKAAKKQNGYKYCCYVTNAAGTVKSKAVKLAVK